MVSLRAHGRVLLDRAEGAATAVGVRATGELMEGSPGEVIAHRAPDFELVVMGSHGKGIFKNLIGYSVTHAVFRRTERPVLIVRGP